MANSSALLTDLYQLSMAYGYWKTGRAEQESVFHLFFRQCPFGGRHAVTAGLEQAVEYLRDFKFTPSDISYLSGVADHAGSPLFDEDFLLYLARLRCTLDLHAMPEGTVAFPHEPILRVTGPLLQAQLVETALLNSINFSTLIATKASRICTAAQHDAVVDFGLRRAQGPDGGITASRAAYIGGCTATSNVLAGKLYGIPIRGTHAHSWVMAHNGELDAFRQYAAVMPQNCTFLVDTYDTIQGVKNAIKVALEMRAKGHEMNGIRLDSGDLVQLSIVARHLLDEAGFPNADVVASSDLDEYKIEKLKRDGARISVWGVGTRLITGGGQAALGGVYKLSCIHELSGWRPVLKLSNDPGKVSTPGILQVRRVQQDQEFQGDTIYDERDTTPTVGQDLLVPVLDRGRSVYEIPPLAEVRYYVEKQLAMLWAETKSLALPYRYPVALDATLQRRKDQLVAEAQK